MRATIKVECHAHTDDVENTSCSIFLSILLADSFRFFLRNAIFKRCAKTQKIRLRTMRLSPFLSYFLSLSRFISHEKLREKARDRPKGANTATDQSEKF